ncbi:MAG TPA: flagellar export chaperone FliS [Bacillota bacterium]
MFENPYQRYLQVQLETSSPVELIIKLYDGAIRFISQGAKALQQKDYIQANTCLLRAERIIDELNINLNMDGGEVAKNLRSLYFFFNQTLITANVKKDGRDLPKIIAMLTSLREAWHQINAEQKLASNKKHAIAGS